MHYVSVSAYSAFTEKEERKAVPPGWIPQFPAIIQKAFRNIWNFDRLSFSEIRFYTIAQGS